MRPCIRALALLAPGLLAVLYGGCALTSKADAQAPRFFSLETRAPAPELPEPAGTPLELRLGQVDAAAHLEERIAYRLRGTELAYYDDRRWTEEPEQYLRRALERELFERRHIRRVVSGAGATLDVELTAFEELRGPPARVRLALSYTLHDARQSSLERSLVIERPLSTADDPDVTQRVAVALTSALSAAVAQMGEEVADQISLPAPVPLPLTAPADPSRATSERSRP
jgi:cholesterol transport system auxiliary component